MFTLQLFKEGHINRHIVTGYDIIGHHRGATLRLKRDSRLKIGQNLLHKCKTPFHERKCSLRGSKTLFCKSKRLLWQGKTPFHSAKTPFHEAKSLFHADKTLLHESKS
ncbi:MAG: hypothetical protein DCF25_02205 [Leptolyngbya foveolarum]|uniref:Uncharacterized protein n=1 Tax=Leptolyngbya foveolarum TaxID=47253 RepID=A0A2W4UU37_9CYAN|nr:MAG: hypothetical protein DCF25_02205 [Leptolyngbya foveolarum]